MTLAPMTHFGDFLRAYFRMLGLQTQEQALEYLRERGLHVSRSSLSSYLTGERRPSRGRMEALLDALDVPVRGDLRCQAYRLAAGVAVDEDNEAASPAVA